MGRALEGVWEMAEERAGDKSSRRVESGRKKGENTRQCLKFATKNG